MITISQIARLAGTTPRAVRLYHQRGLLPEPPRAPNGYRSYGPDELLVLLRIRRLRELGLSLSHIAGLTSGPVASLREALAELDADLARRQRDLAARRAAIAEVLAMPGDLRLPPELASLLEAAREAGYPERALQQERDAVLIALAVEPEALPALREFYALVVADGAGLFADAAAAYEELGGAPADDPRVETVAGELIAAVGAIIDRMADVPGRQDAGRPSPEADHLLHRYWTERSSPAQDRVNRLVDEALRARFPSALPPL